MNQPLNPHLFDEVQYGEVLYPVAYTTRKGMNGSECRAEYEYSS
jgi:hypothetical protein